MKLSAELITRSDNALNTLKDRELSLRGFKIPAIENMGVTQDMNDTIDLTDNDIRSLSNFPLLKRLRSLYLSNNLIARIDPRIAHSLPYLKTLTLTNNGLESLADVGNALAKFPFLEYLSLMGNPIARQKHYREYLIWRCKKVRVLDFKRVKNAERVLAKSLFETNDARPSALAASIAAKATMTSSALKGKASSAGGTTGTFEPGQAIMGAGAAGRLLSAEEKRKIEVAIQSASSLEEITRLEEKLRLGYALEDDDTGPANGQAGKKGGAGKSAQAGGRGQKQQVQQEEAQNEEDMDEDE
ncbi:L domain-like protein [Tilletiaria anomala UBC 951]|uniref:U2 small nuclear ribonucleoprotein A' n=1 Tax=Tilletiaria anomala (strain ATCC 24038 / CBS 436.72 / UBC 951) TaxID=1037660 RepID=A0A066VYV5_TILAU|nr:L domain-like protein [Tilletiaria anomala UBC 951]KDN45458.1 L domain-like protein [Tilletiaria anomala UBC 951]